MLKRFSLAVVLLAVVAAGFGCGGSNVLKRPPQAEIDAFLQVNPDLPRTDMDCINDGRFQIGMLASTVYFLLGEPSSKEVIRQPWAQQEHWRYGKRKGKGKVRLFIIEDKHVVGIDEYGGR